MDSWTPRDRDALKAFLESHTGRRLVTRLRASEAANAIAGARDVLHTSHSAGRSCGYSDCLGQVLSLATVSISLSSAENASQQSNITPSEPDGDPVNAELSDLLARYSP